MIYEYANTTVYSNDLIWGWYNCVLDMVSFYFSNPAFGIFVVLQANIFSLERKTDSIIIINFTKSKRHNLILYHVILCTSVQTTNMSKFYKKITTKTWKFRKLYWKREYGHIIFLKKYTASFLCCIINCTTWHLFVCDKVSDYVFLTW
jgi:hypothetical protein